MRIFAISDVHVDFKENRAWVAGLSDADYRDDALILAGDVSHQIDRMAETFERLTRKFARVFFVPGNHDLWVRGEDAGDSLDKFHRVCDLAARLNVQMQPEQWGDVWVVPLFAWYQLPEAGDGSLYVSKEGEDPELRMWSDNLFVKWPMDSAVDYFLDLNIPFLAQDFGDGPVISFSHFLPRRDLIFSTLVERLPVRLRARDPHPKFNFSRVAGTAQLEKQIRALGSRVHVYGHQHRNRKRDIDGITYVSHCLGYRRERKWGIACALDEGPYCVWPLSNL